MEFHLTHTKEVAVIGEKGNGLECAVFEKYLPDAVIALRHGESSGSEAIPLLEGRDMIDGRPTAYVCENFVCERPVNEVDDLLKLLT